MQTDDTYRVAWEQATYFRETGFQPGQALRAIGVPPGNRPGWDDVVFALGHQHASLSWGGAPE